MNYQIEVLIVEDSEDDALLLVRELRHGGFKVNWERVDTTQLLYKALNQQKWDVILCDYHLPKLDAPMALKIVKQSQPDLPFIVVSGSIGEGLAVQLMKQGANDYLMKGHLARLSEAVKREIREAEIRIERRKANQQLAQAQERLQIAIDNAGVGLWDWQVQTGELIINDRWAEIIGYTTAELEPINYKIWRDNVHPEDLVTALSALEALFRQENIVYECELRMRHKLGAWVWVLSKGKVMEWDNHGKPLRMIGTHLDITGRKQTVDMLVQLNETLEKRVKERTSALRQSESHLREAQQIARLGSWELDIQTKKIIWSAEIFRIFGLESDLPEPTYEEILDYFPADSRDRFVKFIDRAINLKEADEIDLQILRSDSSCGYIFLKVEVVKNKLDQPIHLLGIMMDISDRKLAQTKLQQENNFRQQIVESMAEGLCVCYEIEEFPFLHFTIWNPQMQRITGYSLEEINQLGWDQSLQPISDKYFPKNMHRDIPPQHGNGLEAEWLIRRKDGQRLTISMSSSVLANSDGKSHLLSIIQDITERKQAELKLTQQATQEHLLSSVTQKMRSSLDLEAILNTAVEELHQVLESDRVIVYQVFAGGTGATIAEATSPNFSKILDIVFPEEVFPEKIYDRYVQGRIYTLSDREDPRQMVLPCLLEFLETIQVRAKLVVPIVQQQKLWGLLIAHQCDGARRWQSWEIDLLKQVASQLAIAIQQADLYYQLKIELQKRQKTEEKLTDSNQQLAISNEELMRATKLKDEFLANMSHELRTPLNAILGMTEGMKEGVFGTINDRQSKALNTIENSGTHLLALINDILDVAKIESGQVTLELNDVSIESLCQSSMNFIRQQALTKRIQLTSKIPNNLGRLTIDERRIRQVLINLLNNAVKFTPEGGSIILEVSFVEVDIKSDHVSDLAVSQYLRISVIDTGIGISEENIQKLFQPFIQIDSALNRQYVGTGLGLALVKRIVDLHGGKVSLTSELGVGSHFMIDLPYHNSLPSSLNILSSLETSEMIVSVSDNLTSPLILIADDNEANISTISCYLEAKGYRLLLAKDGQEAIAVTKDHHPHLILMDIQMPIMDGLEAIKHIKQDPELANIPIIALTALAMAGDRARCLAIGANEYLAKPVKLKQLVSTIQILLADNN